MEDGLYLSFYEVNLIDYAGMMLCVNKDKKCFESVLVVWVDGIKVKQQMFFFMFWCIVQVVEWVGDFIESNLIINFNEFN